MNLRLRSVMIAFLAVCLTGAGVAQQQAKKTGVLGSDEIQKVVPTNYFFQDQVATVQIRNAGAIRTTDGQLVVAALVDNSGYSADVAQKYQGLLITTKKISIEGESIPAGQYGMGFTKDGKFHVMDVGTNDVITPAAYHQDDQVKRAVPLKIVANGSDFRLYTGKKYVTIKVQ